MSALPQEPGGKVQKKKGSDDSKIFIDNWESAKSVQDGQKTGREGKEGEDLAKRRFEKRRRRGQSVGHFPGGFVRPNRTSWRMVPTTWGSASGPTLLVSS